MVAHSLNPNPLSNVARKHRIERTDRGSLSAAVYVEDKRAYLVVIHLLAQLVDLVPVLDSLGHLPGSVPVLSLRCA